MTETEISFIFCYFQKISISGVLKIILQNRFFCLKRWEEQIWWKSRKETHKVAKVACKLRLCCNMHISILLPNLQGVNNIWGRKVDFLFKASFFSFKMTWSSHSLDHFKNAWKIFYLTKRCQNHRVHFNFNWINYKCACHLWYVATLVLIWIIILRNNRSFIFKRTCIPSIFR